VQDGQSSGRTSTDNNKQDQAESPEADRRLFC